MVRNQGQRQVEVLVVVKVVVFGEWVVVVRKHEWLLFVVLESVWVRMLDWTDLGLEKIQQQHQ